MSIDIQTVFNVHISPGTTVDHSGWARLLSRHVETDMAGLNRVDYAAIRSESLGVLADYIASLTATTVASLDRPEQFAYWINLYNAVTVRVVATHAPVSSIRDIALGGSLVASVMGGPWKAKLVTVGGIALSLDDIEHAILRDVFRDPRLHYAINCGSVGCPNLRREPFTGARLEAQFDEAARDFINCPRGVAIDGDKLVLSSIFKWYRRDFGGSEPRVLAHIRAFADATCGAAIDAGCKVDRYDYDWRLNGA